MDIFVIGGDINDNCDGWDAQRTANHFISMPDEADDDNDDDDAAAAVAERRKQGVLPAFALLVPPNEIRHFCWHCQLMRD